MRWMWKRALLVGALGLATGSAGAGCAEERPAVNKVQANALAKSFFVGASLQDSADDPEFWTRTMVVDVGYGASQDGLFSASYGQAELTRIKWVIQEDLLIGRITYERIDGSDGKGVGATSKDGVIAVAFPITSHFDIRRDYNPTTGEESNVVVENTTDRPWYEREYMRVDWSRNLNTDSYDFDTLSLIGIYGGVTYEPLAYAVNDPNDEDAPHFDPESGYFDITTKAFAQPETIDLSAFGWGIDTFPACYLDNDFLGGDAPYGNCNPVEITLRHSFRRVVNRDYEPVDWDGYRFQAYGPFLKERHGYARNYGMSDTKWHRFITRYNIWERSHFYTNPAAMTGEVKCFTPETTPVGADPHRDDNGDGTEDECAAVGGGSRCDQFSQKCTLPYALRTPVPQAWYTTSGSNDEYFDGTSWATHEWDVAMRSAVMVARYAECMRTGGADCQGRFPVYHGQMDDNQDAIALAREVDHCRKGLPESEISRCDHIADEVGGQRGYDPGVIALAKMPEMIVLCHSPVEANDPYACGGPRLPEDMTAAQCNAAREAGDDATLAECKKALNVRMGDLRYHTVNNFKAPQTPSAWGIYTDSEDPLTGEKVSASINVWTHINDLFSQGIVDQARYIKGELTTEDVTDGTFVRDWAAASEAAAKGGSLPMMSKAEIHRKIGSLSGKTGAGEIDVKQQKMLSDSALMGKVRELHAAFRHVAADAQTTGTNQAIYGARRNHAVGTDFEAQLMTKPMQQYAGVDGMPMSEGVMNYASPLRGLNPTVQRQIRQMKELALAQRGSCVLSSDAADAPLSLAGLADVLEDKFEPFNPADSKDVQFARAERMRKFIAQRAHYAVIIHEMGHSIGMRHNFVSSYDAWGFRPQYWQLRTRNGHVTSECTDLTADGESCAGPRYFDPVTSEESENMIWMFMQSSTMDYAGETTQDLLGLGAYDFAAARMFYGDAVAVHESPEYASNKDRGKGMISWKMDSFGGLLGIQPEYQNEPIHYSQLGKVYKLLDCGADGNGVWSGDENAVQMFKPADWNDERDGKWHPVVDGLIVKVNGQYTRCKQQRVDYTPWTALRFPKASEFAYPPAAAYYRGGPAVDLQNRVRVPYGFATDRWADLGNLSVYRHDNGADPYELFNFFITSQEVGHIFDNYRRNRMAFSVRSSANRTLERWNTKMRDGAKGLGLLANIYKGDFAFENGYDPDDLWKFFAGANFKENILASGIAFDQFTRMTARPSPGDHYLPTGDTVLRALSDAYGDGLPKVTIPNGATGYYGNIAYGGKPLENALADDKGEYESEYTVNAGCYYDKIWAPMLMAESEDNFISDSRHDFLDARYRSVSLADVFPDGYRRWLANNLTGDDEIKGVRLEADPTGNPIRDPDGFPANAIGWTSWWTPQPEVCFPGDGSIVCSTYNADPGPFGADAPANVAIVDPQVGWEQQKFLIAMTLQYLPENEKRHWLDQMYIWELQQDVDPAWVNRIEFHHPNGLAYVAKTYGTEDIFGKTVQKGVGARILEWANVLLEKAYVVTPVTENGVTWYVPVLKADGQPIVKYAPLQGIDPIDGTFQSNAKPGCEPLDPADPAADTPEEAYGQCSCDESPACYALANYVEVPFFMRQAMAAYGLCVDDDVKGIYDLPSCD